MSEEKVTVEAEPAETVAGVCQDCGELIVRCLRHEAMHIFKTKGREWLLQQAITWMADAHVEKKAK